MAPGGPLRDLSGLALARARDSARAGESPAFDLVVAAGFIVIAVGELELDRLIFGTKLVGVRFFLHPRKPVAWPWRAITALIVVGAPAAIVVYTLARFRVIWRDGLAALREPWGWVLLAGIIIFFATEAFEDTLDNVQFVAPFFLEETAELLASLCFLAAYLMRSRWRRDSGAG